MSSSAATDRVESLLSQVDASIRANQLPQAAEALKEASRLDPQSTRVKDAWIALQNREGRGDNVLEPLRIYIASKKADDGEKALRALKTTPLSQPDAVEAIQLLLRARQDAQLLDELTSALLAHNVEARRSVAVKLSVRPVEAFRLAFDRGEATFNAFAALPLEALLWKNQDQQVIAQQDVFRVCVATLIEPGAEHLEWVMKGTARLLAMAPDRLDSIIDEDVVDAILSFLNIRLPVALRSQATLATSKMLEATKERGEALFADFITQRAAKRTNDDLILVFSAAAAAFPIIPAVTARLFLIDGFVQQLVPNLERNWEDGRAGMRKSHTLETAALELLSAACVDSACREAIKRYCSHWLENLVDEREGEHKAIAALVLAKINTDAAADITLKLEELILADGGKSDQAIEGLAYTSLKPNVKEEVANNDKLIAHLVSALKDRPAVIFGCLTIFTNLTTYRPNLSEEQKKISQLKDYANASKPPPDDPLDEASKVTARCRKVLDANIVPALVECCKHTTSPTNISSITRILLSLAREQSHRTKMAQQGAVRLLLQIHTRAPKLPSQTPTQAIQHPAAHALARLLISLNPEHIFSSALPASNAVSALAPLLSPTPDQGDHHDLLPTFETLLALTNLASMQDPAVRDLELRLAWPQLEDQLLLSSNKLVRRASMELVCNLMAAPACVAKFVGDGSRREAARMRILLALADVDDLPTRRAAGGALAALTEWDAAVGAVLDLNPDGKGAGGVRALLAMCVDESEEMRHRGLVCVANVLGAPGEVGKKGLRAVEGGGGKEVVQEGLKKSKSREVLEIGIGVLKKLM